MFAPVRALSVLTMPYFLLVHAHREDSCRVAYAAWRGFDSPLRGLDALASCASGDHRMFWTVEADSPAGALAQLPPYLAQRTHASEVSSVTIR